MTTTDWVSGSLYLRPREAAQGQTIPGHCHAFDHTFIVSAGWYLVRGWVDGKEVVVQKAAVEYAHSRSLREKHAPWTVLRPIRFPDRQTADGPAFQVQFIAQGEAVPDGGTEIEFAPAGWHVLIHAGILHDMIALDDSHGACIYSHRTAQGDITISYTGWEAAYT